jgi:hypothetical protein
MLLVHRRHIVEPVEIGDRLQIGLVLDQLFGAAMQQADMRIDALDDLAVQLQHQAQHAMGRRVLRAEVDVELTDLGFAGLARWHHIHISQPSLRRLSHRPESRNPCPPRVRGSRSRGIPAPAHRLVEHALLLIVVAHFDKPGQREVLAQRMAVKAVVGQEAAQIRVAGEQDAIKIIGFALEPLAPGNSSVIEGTGVRSSVRRSRGHAHSGGRQEVVDHIKAALAGRIIHAANVDDVDESQLGIIAQVRSHWNDR